MAARPKTILPSWTENIGSLALTLGGSTSTPEPAGVVDVLDQDVALVAVLDLAGEQRRHELGPEVGLEIGGLVADLRVGGAM